MFIKKNHNFNPNKSIKGCGELSGENSPFASEIFSHYFFDQLFHSLLPFPSVLDQSPFFAIPPFITLLLRVILNLTRPH